jgi:hypothetical protein
VFPLTIPTVSATNKRTVLSLARSDSLDPPITLDLTSDLVAPLMFLLVRQILFHTLQTLPHLTTALQFSCSVFRTSVKVMKVESETRMASLVFAIKFGIIVVVARKFLRDGWNFSIPW